MTSSTERLARIRALRRELAALEAERPGERPAPQRPRQTNRLTSRRIETLTAPGFYADGNNLYLDAWNLPRRNWVFRYRRDGRAHDFGLGSYPLVSLAEAREAAVDAHRKLRAGIDPVAERKAARVAGRIEGAGEMTFRTCAEAYIRAKEAGWKNAKHAAQWATTLETYVYPILGSLPAQAIDTALVMKVIEPIWRNKTETASRVRGRMESVLDWARTRGYRQGENPARWKGHLDNLLPKKSKVAPVRNLAALPYTELPAFMAALTGQYGIGALALKFAILTVQRTGTVIGARWDEINIREKLWTIPAARMKVGREHRVPLSDTALDLLTTLKRLPASAYVFSNGQGPVSDMIMLMMLRRMGRTDLTVHGFRSTFSDWCAERTNFPSELREMALAHAISNKVEAAYRRGDMFQKRRALMRAWAAYCCGPAPAGEVVPFISGAAAS